MNLIEAIKSGKPFRIKFKDFYYNYGIAKIDNEHGIKEELPFTLLISDNWENIPVCSECGAWKK